jgi:hypothetical protein
LDLKNQIKYLKKLNLPFSGYFAQNKVCLNFKKVNLFKINSEIRLKQIERYHDEIVLVLSVYLVKFAC